MNARTYFNETHLLRNDHVHVTLMTKIEVSQRWPWKACELASPWTTQVIRTLTYTNTYSGPRTDFVCKIIGSKVTETFSSRGV